MVLGLAGLWLLTASPVAAGRVARAEFPEDFFKSVPDTWAGRAGRVGAWSATSPSLHMWLWLAVLPHSMATCHFNNRERACVHTSVFLGTCYPFRREPVISHQKSRAWILMCGTYWLRNLKQDGVGGRRGACFPILNVQIISPHTQVNSGECIRWLEALWKTSDNIHVNTIA